MSVVDPVPVVVHASLLADASEPGRSTAFLVLLGFVLSFLFIRMSARMIRAEVSWWPGNVETASGLHLHHLVWGIGLMLVCGFLGFALGGGSPWYQITAVTFGIGCGLTLDEFALWVRLEDVYWSREGRSSLDAVVLTAAFMALVVIGTEPLGLGSAETAPLIVYAVAQALVLSVISFLKGRIGLGVLAIFIPLFGLWATFRLAKPELPVGATLIRRQQARTQPPALPSRPARRALSQCGVRRQSAADQPNLEPLKATTGESCYQTPLSHPPARSTRSRRTASAASREKRQ